MQMFADVIVDINNVEVDKIFEYSVRGYNVSVGSRVIVPFGSKVIEGIVIKIKDSSVYPPEKIKSILRVLEETPALTEETLSLMEYVCKTCYVTRASALRLFLPAEMRKGKVKEQVVRFVTLMPDVDVEKVLLEFRKTAVKQKDAVSYLKENGKTHNFMAVKG